MELARRGVLAALGGAAIVPFADWWEAAAQPRTEPLMRASAHSVEGRRALEVYRRAVALMAARRRDDWESWTVWYKMHKYPDDYDYMSNSPQRLRDAQRRELDEIFGTGGARRAQATALFGACPHGSPDFWAWHRMYLAFFERLCRKLTGDTTFALPYWDYSANPTIPVEFRTGGSKQANALWHQRWPGFNDPSSPAPIPIEALDYSFMEQDNFAIAQGQVESTPHGAIHVLLGAGPGEPPQTEFDMTFVGRSPRDPLFWLHHCEIDRLWQGWIAAGNRNPTDTRWLENQGTRPNGYMFFDEMTGQVVMVKNKDVLNAALLLGQVGYTYDALPRTRTSLFSAATAEQRTLASATEVAAGAQRVDQPLLTSAEEMQRLLAPTLFSAGAARVEVRIGEVVVSRMSGLNVGVYLNLPQGVSGEAALPYLVSVVSTFGRAPQEDHAEHAGGAPRPPLVLDATKVVARLIQHGELTDQLTVSTLPLAGSADGQSVRLRDVDVTVATSD